MKQKRQEEILSLLEEFEFLTIHYLTDFYKVSEMTIRRDINELAKANLATKANGGIRKKEKILSTNYKLKKNVNEKLQIGKTMATLIKEGDIVFIGAGTTIYYSLKYIPKNYGAILTNSLVSFNYLNDNGFKNIFLTGGEFFSRTAEFFGIHAENLIETFNIDKAFLSTNGIYNQNVSTSNLSLARIQVKVIEHSRCNFILADHTKFNEADAFTFTNTKYLDGVVTDKKLSEEDFEKIFELYKNIQLGGFKLILTITLNPSMDYVYHTETFALGEHNRLDNPTRMPGGKGINCARALASTGADTMAYTVLGGKNGSIIHNYLLEEDFEFQYLDIPEESRNAITIMHDDKIQTEIVENGPKITDDIKKDIFDQIDVILKENTEINIVTINGSVNSDDLFFYNKLLSHIREATDRDLRILMDLSKDALINVYQSQDDYPDFIKPNEKEFGELVGKKVETKKEILEYLKTHETKIPYILVSCGASGALAKFNGKIFDISIPSIAVVNPTGSGDSAVAGVAYALDNDFSEDDILRMAMAYGMANAAEDGVGVVRQSNIDHFFKEVTIKDL